MSKSCNVYGIKGEGKYRPSNGSEGCSFEAQMCYKCAKENEAKREFCSIHDAVLILDIDHEDYPVEWCYDEEGNPTCTAFEEKP